MTNIRKSKTIVPSPRQRKGLVTLSLLILAESVTVTNAVKLWGPRPASSFHNNQNSRGNLHIDCKESDGTCPASSPVFKRTLGRIPRIGGKSLDCWTDCRHCLGSAGDIPRGGDSTAGTIAKAASEAAMGGATVASIPYGIPLNGWKIIFQAFLTTLNVLCWLIPLRSKKITENKLALGLANAFSGGVFLSLAFGHLIPECVHGFHGYNEVTPYLLVLGGYLLIFFVEKVAFDTHEILNEMESENKNQNKKSNSGKEELSSGGRSAVILLAALAVHSILEMTALGLADTFGDSAILTLSIALHQPAESIALLVAFLKSGMPKKQIIQCLSVFSAMGPIGVALGMAVNEFAAPIVDAIMVAVVAGTFVYVGATEVIPEEWEDSEHKWKKFLALMGGIVSILIITQYTATLEL